MQFAYEQEGFLPLALAALDKPDDIVLTVSPRLASVVERALSFHDAYFHAKKNGRQSLLLLLRFGVLGFKTPSLWAVLNKAELRGRLVETERSSDGLVIKIGTPS